MGREPDTDLRNHIRLRLDLTIGDCLSEGVRSSPQQPFLTDGAARYTRGEFADAVQPIVKVLQRMPGNTANIAVMLPNTAEHVALIFALAIAGKKWVPIHTRLKGAPLRRLAESCPIDLFILSREYLIDAQAAILDVFPPNKIAVVDTNPETGRIASAISAANGRAKDKSLPSTVSQVRPSDTFCICFTSGTSGAPKGAMLTHQNLVTAGIAAKIVSGFDGPGRMLHWEPLSHLSGVQLLVLALLYPCELVMMPRFGASRFLKLVADNNVRQIHYLGGVLQILARQPRSSLDRAHGASIAWGAGCPVESWVDVEQRFGVKVRECYGSTETAGFVTTNLDGPIGSVGKPLPWMTVDVCRENGERCAPNEDGEIVVTPLSPGCLASGYYLQPMASARAFRDGSFHTGDIGRIDENGYLYFVGRLSDTVRHKGENVSAWEIESVVRTHENVRDCAVIGVQSDIGEQDIKIFLEPNVGHKFDISEIRDYCRDLLPGYQVPRYFVKVDGFERTPSERIVKHGLSKSTKDCWDSWAQDRRRP